MASSTSPGATAARLTEPANTNSPARANALRLYQETLDHISDAVMRFDKDQIISRLGFPFRMSTHEQEFLLESPQDWIDSAEMFHRNLVAQGVNHYIRLASEADFLSENYIEGRHTTHTLRNATPVVPPYENRATLTRTNGHWRMTQLDSAIVNARWPIAVPKVHANGKLGTNGAAPDAEIRMPNASPMAIYQDYIDRLSQINMDDDADAWCALCEFPHNVHIEHIDEVIKTPEQLVPFLDMIRRMVKLHNVDQIVRKADRAEFLSGSQICGYHQTSFLSKGETKLGPVASRYILNRRDTTWRMVSVTNSISNTEFPYDLPELGEQLISLRDIQERTKRK